MRSRKELNKLDRAVKRMLLRYLGIDIKEQPSTRKEIVSLLVAYQDNDQEKFDYAYDFVVNQTVQEEGEKKIENVLQFDDAKKLISEEITIIKESALYQLEHVFKKDGKRILDDIVDSFEKAVEVESKKFNVVKHKIYNNDKEVKEIEGVVCEEFETLLQLATERVNSWMVGPSGCGKTHVSAQIADAMDLPYASQSCSAGVSETAFTGKLLPLGDHGKFEYVESDFVRIYEGGGVFLFDEIDAADANVMVFLNQALSNESFHCPQRIKKTLIKRHKNFIAVCAANTFGAGADSLYTGRNSLDAATLDRFRLGTVVMGYSPIVEEAIIDSEILEFGRTIRARISQHNLKKILSTRFMRDASIMKEGQKWTMSKIQDMYFADWSREEISVIGGKLHFSEPMQETEKTEEAEKTSEECTEEEKLIKIGGGIWEKNGKRRIYFNKVIGRLNGGSSFYYDLITGKYDWSGLSSVEATEHKNKINDLVREA